MVDPDGIPEHYFGRARIVAGLLLEGAAVLLAFIDAFRTDYALDPITLGLFIGGGGACLGIGVLEKAIGRILSR